MYLNPAYSGDSEFARLDLNYRNRWPFHPELRKAFVTYSASLDHPVPLAGGGISLLFTRDIQAEGTFKYSDIGFIYSYHAQLADQFRMNAALQFTLSQNTLDAGDIILPDMVNSSGGMREYIPSVSTVFLDYSLGFKGSYMKTDVGFCIHHLTRPPMLNDTFLFYLNRKFSVSVKQIVALEAEYPGRVFKALIPMFLWQQQESSHLLEYGCIYQTDPLSTGLFLKHNCAFSFDAVILYLGIIYKSYTFGYSFDYNIPAKGVSNPFSGGHELVFRYNLYKIEKNKAKKAIKSLKM